ncbi:lipoprotein, partial [Vibrio hibernica]
MKKLLVTTAIITILAGCNADDVQDNVNQLNDFTEPQSRKASGILYSAT